MVSLKRLLSIGSEDVRPSLVEFALNEYQPHVSCEETQMCWNKLSRLLNQQQTSDAVLTGLQNFLHQIDHDEYARICLSLNCDVAFEVSDGQLCLDAHDNDVACCSSRYMLDELNSLVASYDQRFG